MVLSVLIRWASLTRSMVRSAARDEEFRALLASIGVLLVVGTAFYALHEGWSVVDSFYFSVMTLTTIGYGDLTPTTDLSKLFTVAFALSGIGLLVAFASELARQSIARRTARRHRGDAPG
ncbi:MAG TPA: potassium channel family protein [Solirubrobacterales bacterium]|nr:potassium channel family protein [Solirubrobacterales bacterium]